MGTSYSGQKVGTVLFLIWAILCILFFIGLSGKVSYVQWSNLTLWQLLGAKLERLHPVSDLANLLWSFAGMAIFSLACTSLGAFVAGKIRIRNQPYTPTTLTGLVFLATEFLIGNGIFSLIFLALAGLFRLTPVYVISLLVIGFLLGASQMNIGIQEIVSEASSRFEDLSENRWSRLMLILSASILCLSLLLSTARISYDSSAIYFTDAKLTALNKQIQFFVDDNFVVSAFQTSIQYTALIQIFGDQSARLFSWFCGIIFIIFALALAEQMGISKQGRIILLALLLTSTALVDLMGDGKIDIQSSAPAIAAVYWMVADGQNKTPEKPHHFLIGFFIGFSIIARPFNVFLVSLFVSLFYFQWIFFRKGFQPLDYKRFLSSTLYIAAGAIGLGIYHLFANWMIHGNPLAFFSSVSKINASAGPWDYNPDQILAIRILYPFIATFYNSPQTLGNISPLFLAFLPALLLPEIRKNFKLSKQMWVLVIISIVTLLLWIFLFFTVYEIRYVLFLWAIIFMPVAEIIAGVLENKDRLLQHISSTLIITLLVFSIVRTVYISLDTYSPIDKQGNPQCFCESLSPINKSAASGDRVLTLSAFRYYLRTDLFACSTKHDEYKKLQAAAQNSSEAFWLEVYRQGYKFISYEHDYTIRHLQMGIIPSPSNTPEWLELEQIYSSPDGGHAAYRINVKTPPDIMDTTCKRNASGIWEVRSAE